MRHFFRTNHIAQTMLLLLVLLMTSLVIGDGVLTPAQTGIMCNVLRRRSMRPSCTCHLAVSLPVSCMLKQEAMLPGKSRTEEHQALCIPHHK